MKEQVNLGTYEDSSPSAGHPQDYLSIVIRQFKKSKLGVIGLCLVLFMFLVAILAPFLAESKPIIMKYEGKLSSPLLNNLTIIDWLLLLTLPTVLIGWITYYILKWTKKYDRGRTIKLTFLIISIPLLIAIFLTFSKKYPLDKTNYKDIVTSFKDDDYVVFPLIPYSPLETDLMSADEKSTAKHILGTDGTGRDIMSRMIHGSRVSLSVGFVAVGISLTIGIILGALAGYYGGWVDNLIQRLIEIVICFPTFFLILTITAFLPQNIFNIMIAIGIVGWTGVARLVRGEFLKLRSQDFVTAARAIGTPASRIIFRHILPNGLAPVFVSATFGVAGAILVESSLSFLGFGVPVPTPSWGQILSDGRTNYEMFVTLYPGIAIFLTVTSYNLVGEALRDALDPRLKI